MSELQYGIFRRMMIYQKERFPLLAHIPLITAFTFSAIGFSRLARGQQDFISAERFAVAVFTTVTLFLLLRIFDEFKDREEDAQIRPYLPVPRGLVRLEELRNLGIGVAMLQIGINALLLPAILPLYFLAIAYLLLMGREFFVRDWLKSRPIVYMASHMLIVPLIDVYASGADWRAEGVAPPPALAFFFAVSFLNGIVIEFGRKIRPPEKEEAGYTTYSAMYGPKGAAVRWLLCLTATLFFSMAAAWRAGHAPVYLFILSALFIICAMPALLFISRPKQAYAKGLELASGIWTLGMYLVLGGAPMFLAWMF